jgi:hypothetical protein
MRTVHQYVKIIIFAYGCLYGPHAKIKIQKKIKKKVMPTNPATGRALAFRSPLLPLSAPAAGS